MSSQVASHRAVWPCYQQPTTQHRSGGIPRHDRQASWTEIPIAHPVWSKVAVNITSPQLTQLAKSISLARYRAQSTMVRISIPTLPSLPPLPPSALTLLPAKSAASHLATFLANGKGKTAMLTGAGLSVDSGIRAYRGEDGTYSNPNYK